MAPRDRSSKGPLVSHEMNLPDEFFEVPRTHSRSKGLALRWRLEKRFGTRTGQTGRGHTTSLGRASLGESVSRLLNDNRPA